MVSKTKHYSKNLAGMIIYNTLSISMDSLQWKVKINDLCFCVSSYLYLPYIPKIKSVCLFGDVSGPRYLGYPFLLVWRYRCWCGVRSILGAVQLLSTALGCACRSRRTGGHC
nr:hypothetical protein 591p_00147 [Serratia proteamaculans]